MTLLAGAIQPPLISLFSSTSQPSLSPIFTQHLNSSDSKRSIIVSLPDTAQRPNLNKRKWDAQPDDRQYVPLKPRSHKECLRNQVLHIQGSSSPRTYIQAGTSSTEAKITSKRGKKKGSDFGKPLGIELKWIHFQLKRLGRRHFSLEVGVVDTKGIEGVVRLSTFQKDPTIHRYRNTPLIHLPIQLPEKSSSTMTEWLELDFNLSSLLRLFQTLPNPINDPEQAKTSRKETQMPTSQFAYISYIKVYASCRLRRIFFTSQGMKTMDNLDSQTRAEFALFSAG